MPTIAFQRTVYFEEPNGREVREGAWEQISGPTSELKHPYSFSAASGEWVEEDGKKLYREVQIATLDKGMG